MNTVKRCLPMPVLSARPCHTRALPSNFLGIIPEFLYAGTNKHKCTFPPPPSFLTRGGKHTGNTVL